MKNKLLKDMLIEIKNSMGRFISILLIVAIGVAFFSGVKASAPAMKHTADHYFDEYNLMDIKLLSTLGFSNHDIEAIKECKGIEGIYASHSLDAITKANTQQHTLKVLSYPSQEEDRNFINQPKLIKGRMPTKANECLFEYHELTNGNFKIGDMITLTSGTDENINDTLKNTQFEIVGLVNTPYYLSYEKGSTSIGSGKIDNYVLLDDRNFKSDIYTEVYLTIKGAKAFNSYEDDYFDQVDKVSKQLETLKETQALERLDTIQAEALQTLNTSIIEYESNKKSFEDEMTKAKNEINVNERTIESNEQALQEKEKEIQSGYTSLQQNKDAFVQALPSLNTQLNELKSNYVLVSDSLQQIHLALQNPLISEAEKEQLLAQQLELITTRQTIETGIRQIETTIQSTNMQLQQAQAQLDAGKKAIVEGSKQIEQARNAIKDARATLLTEERDAFEALNDAKAKIEQAKDKIESMKAPTWFILDRHSHYSYMDYGSAADRMDAIATIFPVFFFLVAALVCLTTMTRMVDEQRQQIGTLKALGYSKISIASKYIIYAAIASISGGIIGCIVGMIVFPTVIFNAWSLMYTLPSIKLSFQLDLAITAIVIATLVTVGAALLSCYKELVETPALLMRPKAPKDGKRILLQRIPLIWKRFSFSQKVCTRNIFRYKKRFFMSVIGISGCSALLVAGYGITDSISQVVTKQYDQIYKYNVSLTMDDSLTQTQRDSLLNEIKEHDNTQDAMFISSYNGLYEDVGEDKSVEIIVIDDIDKAKQFYTFENRITNDSLKLNDQGAIITEKLANEKNLSVNDTIKVDNGDGIKKTIKITGIMENYIGHALYMSPSYYQKVYKETPKDTTTLAILKDTSTNKETSYGNDFTQKEGIKSIVFYSGLSNSFADTISSLNIIIIVLIISAGLLAFVVLYNLSNVNISERLREIATIKVLGFYDKEVSSYVSRESIILTIIGAICGLLLGIVLHSIIMDLAELDTIMFGRNIEPLSFLLAFIITIIFSLLVNLVMHHKLKKIPMVESLKSIE